MKMRLSWLCVTETLLLSWKFQLSSTRTIKLSWEKQEDLFITGSTPASQCATTVNSHEPIDHFPNYEQFATYIHNRPIRLTQCCTQFKSLRVKVLCVFYLHDNAAFTFKWYGNTWNKTFYSQRIWIGYNIELAESVYLAPTPDNFILLWRASPCGRGQTTHIIHYFVDKLIPFQQLLYFFKNNNNCSSWYLLNKIPINTLDRLLLSVWFWPTIHTLD